MAVDLILIISSHRLYIILVNNVIRKTCCRYSLYMRVSIVIFIYIVKLAILILRHTMHRRSIASLKSEDSQGIEARLRNGWVINH
jgi:hypothetical protein